MQIVGIVMSNGVEAIFWYICKWRLLILILNDDFLFRIDFHLIDFIITYYVNFPPSGILFGIILETENIELIFNGIVPVFLNQ